MKSLAPFCLSIVALAWLSSSAPAQHLDYHRGHYHWHRNVPHFHDAAGHMIDRYGHHIDGHGNHTRIGVYENGSISPYSRYPGVLPSYRYGGHHYDDRYSLYDDAFGYRSYYPAYYSALGGPLAGSLAGSLDGSFAAPSNTIPPVSRVIVGQRANAQSNTRWPTRGPVIISNPKDSGGEVRYRLNGREFTIKPGYQQRFEDDRAWVVAFGSGGAKGDLRYTLVAGVYRFVAAETGWDLKLTPDSARPNDPSDIPPPLPSPE